MIKKFAIITILILVSTTACAGDKAGNGGEAVALSFKTTAGQAIDLFEKSPLAEATPDLVSVLRSKLNSATILSSSEPLLLDVKGTIQVCTVINYPDSNRIMVSTAWDGISDQNVKLALAIHELAGLAGHEASGIYTVSAGFLSYLGYKGEPVSTLSMAKGHPQQSGDITSDMGAWLLSWNTQLIPKTDIHLPAKTLSFSVCGSNLSTSEQLVASYSGCDSLPIKDSRLAVCGFRFYVANETSRVWTFTRPLPMVAIARRSECSNCSESSERLVFELPYGNSAGERIQVECAVYKADGAHAMTLGELEQILGEYFEIRQPTPQPL